MRDAACELNIVGLDDSVSRQHARLHYAFERGRWEMEVLGKNGVTIDGEGKG